jgi:hypothetical protein
MISAMFNLYITNSFTNVNWRDQCKDAKKKAASVFSVLSVVKNQAPLTSTVASKAFFTTESTENTEAALPQEKRERNI